MNDFELVHFKPGEQLFSAGDQADKLYVVQQGTVEMVDASTGQAFAAVSAGQSFGEQALLPGGIRSASAVARDEVTCLFIEAESLRSLLEKQSPILAPMFEALLLQQSMHNALRRPR
jgi:CRP-like cAMP-binding protein